MGAGRPRDLFGRDLLGAATPRTARNKEVRVATVASEDSASVASLRQETPRRERESWWKAASVSELKDHGDSSPLRSPQSRREVKQAMGPQRSIADIGSEGLLFFSPPSRCPQEHRFDVPATVTRRRSSPLPVPKASRETSEKCRYFCEPPYGQRRAASDKLHWQDFPAAGHATQHHRRFDTPAGEEALMGRARSQTPDYHRRYAQNAAGSSLPGCSTAQVASVPESPRSVRSLQYSGFNSHSALQPSRQSQVACHFNRGDAPWFSSKKPLSKKAFALSSSSVEAAGQPRSCSARAASGRRSPRQL